MATEVKYDVTFDSGRQGKAFSSIPSEASAYSCISAADHTSQYAYVEYIEIYSFCGASVRVVDGTQSAILGPIFCPTGQVARASLDFRGDPLKCLGPDGTSSGTITGVDISSSGAGRHAGFIKWYWGP